MEQLEKGKKNHSVIMQNRSSVSISGVDEVDSFDETAVILIVGDMYLNVEGDNLHIAKLNIDAGELYIEGNVSAIVYSSGAEKKTGGILSRIFKA